MNVRKKYEWAIDLAKEYYDKVIVRELDYGWGLALAVENDRGEMRGLVLQRPEFSGTGENRRFMGLYELRDMPTTRENLIEWLQTCFDTPIETKKRVFDVRDC